MTTLKNKTAHRFRVKYSDCRRILKQGKMAVEKKDKMQSPEMMAKDTELH